MTKSTILAFGKNIFNSFKVSLSFTRYNKSYLDSGSPKPLGIVSLELFPFHKSPGHD